MSLTTVDLRQPALEDRNAAGQKHRSSKHERESGLAINSSASAYSVDFNSESALLE
jgi:hypothetical protein